MSCCQNCVTVVLTDISFSLCHHHYEKNTTILLSKMKAECLWGPPFISDTCIVLLLCLLLCPSLWGISNNLRIIFYIYFFKILFDNSSMKFQAIWGCYTVTFYWFIQLHFYNTLILKILHNGKKSEFVVILYVFLYFFTVLPF